MSLPDRHLGDRVAALADGRLTPAERTALLDHVTRCRACRIQYDEQRAIKSLLGELRGIDAPDDLTSRLARLAVPSPLESGHSYLAPVAGRHGRSAGQRARLAGASLLSLSLVGVSAAYAAGAAPVGLSVVPPVDRFVREHDRLSGGLPLSEPVLTRLPTTSPGASSSAPSSTPLTPTTVPVSDATQPSRPTAPVTLLHQAMNAERSLAFAGTELVWRAGLPDQELQVTHLPGRGAVVAARGASGSDQAVFDSDSAGWNDVMLGLLSGSYALVLDPDEVVLERPVHVVEALRADGSVAARFRLDAATGMLLQRSQYDHSGTVIESAGFTSLTFAPSTPNHLPPMLPSAHATALTSDDARHWQAVGWPCSKVLGGLTLVGASELTGTRDRVLHLTYSDGLSLVSVFEQPGYLDTTLLDANPAGTLGGYQVETVAAPAGGRQVFWSAGGWVFTVVSDAAGSAVDDVVAALPHDPADGVDANVPERLGRGAGRMLSWLNPLD